MGIRRLVAITPLCLCFVAPYAGADIYKFVDAQGRVHFADRKLGPGYRLLSSSRGARGIADIGSFTENRRHFEPLVRRVAHRYRLESALIHAVITAESSYDPEAISKRGAVGLMQLMPETARRYGVRNRRNPVENIYGGARYLRDLLFRFKNLTLALAAYNAGENAVAKYGNRIPPYRETRNYVRKVLEYYRQYRRSS
ncbi:MAG: lytic transglycosylase domain-containing protein [Gammaproteobacteria bacterium]|nr:lytic transglycosylase domain-containing protein [Gammaproteobacteria bacterium]NIR85126.1 lytic transglycosylase domain-containing protein [Gammaproteobacteria bacterium]NIR92055.1 lytic transglycosylase domain-containing protein [Gammaproteobacteria bacterium]NIU06175.1 lytic transglycosylase domain-containing protein [Gammaproteobacteria bacterium]NIV53174.1 transglycosylase SLT domain-containing protein [Gammaproteobacteria bacterium]